MNKEQLKEAVGELNSVDTAFEYDGVSYIDTAVSVNQVYDLIDQLDEPEITLNEAFNKLEETHILSKGEIVKHFEQLEIHNGKVTYGDYETLSLEWIEEHRKSYTMEDSVEISDLQNLLVPKQEEKNSELYGKFVEIVQMSPVSANELLDTLANLVAKQHAYGTEKPVEITEEQAWEVIHGKYGDETLQNNIDYVESQGYVVIEKPVIPQFVADWISGHHEKFDLYAALRRLEEGSTRDYDAYKWYRKNTHTFVNAYLTGKYEVGGKQKYYLKIGNLYLAEPLGDMTSDIVRMTRDKGVAYQFTDEKSIATHLDKFEGAEAVKVEELEE